MVRNYTHWCIDIVGDDSPLAISALLPLGRASPGQPTHRHPSSYLSRSDNLAISDNAAVCDDTLRQQTCIASAMDRPSLTPDDVDVLRGLTRMIPNAFSVLDADMLAAFVRSYANYKNRLETTAKHIGETLAWRAGPTYGAAAGSGLSSPPAGRDEFERLYQAGPIGRDSCGRAVVVERIGSIPASASAVDRSRALCVLPQLRRPRVRFPRCARRVLRSLHGGGSPAALDLQSRGGGGP